MTEDRGIERLVGMAFLTARVSEPDPGPEVPSLTLGVRKRRRWRTPS